MSRQPTTTWQLIDTGALVGILLASVFSIYQISEARRTFSLTSLSTIKHYSTETRTPYYSFLMENIDTLSSNDDTVTAESRSCRRH